MKRADILFESSHFNLSRPKGHFINPDCFGEDLAIWLRQELEGKDTESKGPFQEDWGWYLDLGGPGLGYMVGVTGFSYENAGDPDKGEWRLMIQRRSSLRTLLLGGGGLEEEDPIVSSILQIVSNDSRFHDVRSISSDD